MMNKESEIKFCQSLSDITSGNRNGKLINRNSGVQHKFALPESWQEYPHVTQTFLSAETKIKINKQKLM